MSDPTPPEVQSGAPGTDQSVLPAPIYSRLSTDFYPWSEVIADLKTRAQSGQSLLFQAEAGGVQARFVWQAGQFLGGHSGPRDLNFAGLMRGLPRARVSLLPLTPEAAAALWEHRTASGQPLRGTPGEVRAQLGGQTGLLLGREVSYWEGGEPRCGGWTAEGAAQEWQFVPLRRALDRHELEVFWTQVLAVTHSRAALDEPWRQVSLALATEYPVLDPFTREITVKTGELRIDPAVSAEELQSALLAAYREVLRRLGLPLSSIPLDVLRQHDLWEASGLAELQGERP